MAGVDNTRQIFNEATNPNPNSSSSSSSSSLAFGRVSNSQQQQQCSANQQKKFYIKYLGSATLHKNFTMPMLEWIARDIKRQTVKATNLRQFKIPARDVAFQVQSNQLTAHSCKDGHCIFIHPMQFVTKYAQQQYDKTCFAYLMKDSKGSPLSCHLFQAKSIGKVLEIFSSIREAASTTLSSPAGTAAAADINNAQGSLVKLSQQAPQLSSSPPRMFLVPLSMPTSNSAVAEHSNPQSQVYRSLPGTPLLSSVERNSLSLSQNVANSNQQLQLQQQHQQQSIYEETSYQFEVLFVKKLKLQCKRVPATFVDDALETLKSFEVLKTTTIVESKAHQTHSKLGKQIIRASVDERQEYDESCQTPPIITKTKPNVDNVDQEQTTIQQQNNTQVNENSSQIVASTSSNTDDDDGNNSSSQLPKSTSDFLSDFLPYNTITSSDLNKRIAAIPSVSASSVSLDQETRQTLARQLRESLLATSAANMKKRSLNANDARYSSGERLNACDEQDSATTANSVESRRSSGSAALDSLQSSPIKQNVINNSSQQNSKTLLNSSNNNNNKSTNNFDLFRRSSTRSQTVRNRTMLLLIAKTELCAISTDSHQMLFSKSYNSIVHCLQGVANKDHFGLICRDSVKINPNSDSHFGFVFKCQSEKVVREIMAALKQVIYSSHYNCNAPTSPYNPLSVNSLNKAPSFPKSAAMSSAQLNQLSSSLSPKLSTQASSSSSLTTVSTVETNSNSGLNSGDKDNSLAQNSNVNQKSSNTDSVTIHDQFNRKQISRKSFDESSNQTSPTIAINNQQQKFFQRQDSLPITGNARNTIKDMFCDDCPLYWFHRLCCDVESLTADACKTIIVRRFEKSSLLKQDERDEINAKFNEFEISNIDEYNEILMSLLRQHCERRQIKHNSNSQHIKMQALKQRQHQHQQQQQQQQQQQLQPSSGTGARLTFDNASKVNTQLNKQDSLADSLVQQQQQLSNSQSTSSTSLLTTFARADNENITSSDNIGSRTGALLSASTLSLASSASSQCLADASSLAMDNLKRATNSISCSIETLLRRPRASFQSDDGISMLSTLNTIDDNSKRDSLSTINKSPRSESFKERSRGAREATLASRTQGDDNSILQAQQLKRSLSSASGKSPLCYSESSSSHDINSLTCSNTNINDNVGKLTQVNSGSSASLSWTESLSKTINGSDFVGLFRRRSLTVSSDSETTAAQAVTAEDELPTTTKQSLLSKLGVSTESFKGFGISSSDSTRDCSSLKTSLQTPMLSGSFWRKNIFNKTRTNQQINDTNTNINDQTATTTTSNCTAVTSNNTLNKINTSNINDTKNNCNQARKPRTKEELRALWKKAIREQVTLLRMDKQNQKLSLELSKNRHIRKQFGEQSVKLSYSEVPFNNEAIFRWQRLLMQDASIKVDFSTVMELVKLGVPKQRRGEAWMFLMNQYRIRHGTSFQTSQDFQGDANQTYKSLLSQLSLQQHEIFVDIGRTFPNHPYYSQYLSIGQLSLFNLLKAYSLLDQQVGYCQGLSFVAGILLLHVNTEDEAFELMRHLLFNFGLRKQYLPSMDALQLQLYQLTRLLRDLEYDIFNHFDRYNIAPSLYAAPWFLTLFASQFPLGFVARLLDLIFLIGIEAIFRVSLNLLTHHRAKLLFCSSLESIMEYIKNDLIRLDEKYVAEIFDKSLSLDLRNNLIEYEIEYTFYSNESAFNKSNTHLASIPTSIPAIKQQ